MSATKSELYDHLEEAVDKARRMDKGWREDLITVESVPSALFSAARAYEYLATTAALLGATEQTQAWFAESARWYTESSKSHRLRRDVRPLSSWRSEPSRFTRALYAAVVSRDDTVLRRVATTTLEMDESYIEVFEEDRPDRVAQYFNAKTFAALAINDGSSREFLDGLEVEIDRLDDPSRYWQAVPRYYRGLLESSESTVQAAVSDLFEFHANQDFDQDDPRQYVLHQVCAYLVLARRHGMDVSIESDRLPEAVLREDVPDDDVELDADLSGLQFTSDVGMFELERDDENRPVVAGRIYHPGGEPVTVEDVPEREAGRVLSDEWVEAALDEAEWREHYDDDLVADARAAFEDGTLRRTLVVVQDRTDEHLFEESLTELPIDEVELLKGAGR